MAVRRGKISHNGNANRQCSAQTASAVTYATGVEHDQVTDQDRADGDREIDRLQKELLAFVVDQLTAQADNSGIVTLPPKLMAAIDAQAESTLAQRVAGVTLPDADAFGHAVMARVGCEGRGLADRVSALEGRIDTLLSASQRQATLLDAVAGQLNVAPATAKTASGADVAKRLPVRLIAAIAGVVALIAAVVYFGGSLAREALTGTATTETRAVPSSDAPTVLPPGDGAVQPGFEADPVTEPSTTAVPPPATTTTQRPSARQSTGSAPRRAQPPSPTAASTTPETAAPSPSVTPDQSFTDGADQGR